MVVKNLANDAGKNDYYHTNSIARASKVMSECKQISKKFLFTGIEKAS